MKKESRTVTRKLCCVCNKSFRARRADVRYCSGRCRQRANRARQGSEDIDQEIEAARLHYWDLLRRKEVSKGGHASQVVTLEAQLVDEDGNVFMHAEEDDVFRPRKLVATGHPVQHPGFAAWGLEAAGPPFSAPPHGETRPASLARWGARRDDR